MANADVVWVDVLPSFKRWMGEFRKGTTADSAAAGRAAGDSYSKAFEERAVAGAEKASAAVSAARRKQEDAAGRVNVAQARLIELQNQENVSTARLAAAVDAYSRAQRAHVGAQEGVERATRANARAQQALQAANDGAGFSFRQLAQSMTELNARSDALDRTSKNLGASIRTVGSVAAVAFGSLAGQAGVGALVAVTGAAAGAAGSILLLPAAATAVAAPLATFQLGMIGVNDAFKALADGKMEKFEEALADMAPAAAATFREVAALKPAFDDLRRSVQDEMFYRLNTTVRELGQAYLPMVREALKGYAIDINAAAHSMGAFALQKQTIEDVRTIITNSRTSFQELTGAMAPALQILRDIGVVGSTFLPGLSAGFTDLAWRTAEWVARARESGVLRDIISQSLSVVGQLGTIMFNVGAIIFQVFRVGAETGRGFLGTLVDVTTGVRQFVMSAEGMQVLRDAFAGVGNAVAAIGPVVQVAASIILGQLLPAFSQFAVILAPIVHELLLALRTSFAQLAPLVPQLASTVGALVGSFIPLIPLVTQLALILLPPLLTIITALGPAFPFLAIGIFAAVQAFQALNALVTFMKLAMELYAARMIIVQVATGLWTAAQWLLNAALTANPIGIVIIALAALGAALYLAWTHSETFRNIVTGAWNAIKDAVGWAWDNVLKPVIDAFAAAGLWLWQTVLVPAFNGILAAWNAVSSGLQWAWNNIIKPTWDFLMVAAQYLLTFLATVIFAPILIAWNLLSAGMKLAYDNIILPMWNALQAAARFMWENVLRPVWDAVKAAWDALGVFFRWVYDTIILPMWNALQTAARFMWENVLRPIWDAIKAAWNVLGALLRWVYDTIIQPMFNALQAGINFLWNNVARPVWDTMRNAFDALGKFFRWVYDNIIQPAWDAVARSLTWLKDRFQDAVNWIRDIWNGIKRVLAVPINFMINTVWNRGVVPAWNAVADLLPGVGKIKPQAPIAEAATGGQFTSDGVNNYRAGGQLQGRWRGEAADNLLGIVDNKAPVKLNPLEWIHPVRAVKKYGGKFMRAVQHGLYPQELAENFQHYARGGQIPGFATGNQIFNVTKSAFPRAKLSSSFRPGDNGFHGKNMAADMGEAGFPGGAGRPYIAAMKKWWVDNFGKTTEEIIYNGVGSNAATNVKNGKFFAYSAGVQAGHKNHLHVAESGALSGATGGAGPGGILGAIVDIAAELKAKIVDLFAKPARSYVNQIGDRPPPAFNDIPRKMGNTLIDKAVEFFNGKADEQGAAGSIAAPLGVSVGPVVDQVRSAANLRGWGSGGQWNALDWLIRKESGWNPGAQNPVSTASGLFQHIDSTWRAYRPPQASGYAKMRQAPVAMQAAAGMNYIGSRYGDPVKTKAFWAANGWYSGGGQIPAFARGGHTRGWRGEGMAMLHPDERVLAPEQDTYFRRFVDAVEGRGAGGGDRMLAREINIHANTTDQGQDVVDKLWHKVRVADRGGVYTFTR